MSDTVEYKMVVVVNRGLGMSPGKTAAQAIHAGIYGARGVSEEVYTAWDGQAQPVVVLKVADEVALVAVAAKAEAAGLPVETVHDSGRTQVADGAFTTVAIGPAACDAVDAVTGGLKLL